VASRNSSGNVFYWFADQLGSTRTITDANGNLCYDAEFTPYGQEISHTERLQTTACPPSYKFTGYERDPETTAGSADTGLDYAFARFYSSRLGRFLSADPLGGSIGDLQSHNAYAYVLNNPLTLVDALGLDACFPVFLPNGEVIFECWVTSNPDVPGGEPDEGGGSFSGAGSGPEGMEDPGSLIWCLRNNKGNRAACMPGLLTKIKNVARKIGNYIPTLCGGGGFFYGGGRGSGGVAAVGFYGIKAWDSRSGASNGLFGDITIGEGVQGGYGYAVYKDGSAEHFLFASAGVDLLGLKVGIGQYGSHVEGQSWIQNQTGINIDIGTEGGGVGFGFGPNIDTLTSCFDHGGK
jgi:RHS repeat-associated protein